MRSRQRAGPSSTLAATWSAPGCGSFFELDALRQHRHLTAPLQGPHSLSAGVDARTPQAVAGLSAWNLVLPSTIARVATVGTMVLPLT